MLQEERIHRAFSNLSDLAIRVDPKKWIIGVSPGGFKEVCESNPDIQKVKFYSHNCSYQLILISGLDKGKVALIF